MVVDPVRYTRISFLGMTQRCTNPNSVGWKYYGGRGITVCDRWRTFDVFLSDMGERPRGMTLDRIDSNGNYEPSNCKWSTPKEQRYNARNLVLLEYKGVRYSMRSASETFGISMVTLFSRRKYGWSTERILTEPVHRKKPALAQLCKQVCRLCNSHEPTKNRWFSATKGYFVHSAADGQQPCIAA